MRKEKGITLVALVITIIVLIILAAVSIRAVMNDGIIINAKGAKESWEESKTDEEGKLSYLLGKIEGKESENGSITIEKTSGEKLTNYRIYGNSVQGKLPSEYQQVEYIESTGTQYINTGVYGDTPNYRILLDVETTQKSSANNNYYMGIYDGTTYYGLFGITSTISDINDKYRLLVGKGGYNFSDDNYVLNERTKLEVKAQENDGVYTADLKINDVTKIFTYEEYKNVNLPLYLFNVNYNNKVTNEYGYFKLYNCLIEKNGNIVRNFIPCYRKADNVVGLYDLVENKFYTNSGTGTFSKGSDCPTPEVPLEVESVGDYDVSTGKYKIPIKVNEETTNIYLDEPLRKIGDYVDYIDFENSRVVRNIDKQIYSGSENWESSGVFNNTNVFRLDSAVHYSPAYPLSLISNYFTSRAKIDDDDWKSGEMRFQSISYVATNRIYLSHKATTTDELKVFLRTKYNEDNPVYILYPLKTPIEKTIDLPEIQTATGTTNITIDTVTTPSKIEVDY